METSAELNELASALAKAQGAMKPALKDTANPFFKTNYADLASCWYACRAPLADNGLSVIQTPSADQDGAVCVTTRLMHSSGQWIQDKMCCKATKQDAQGLGSVTTYLRRYGLAAIVGISQADDDGEAAVGRGYDKKPTKKPVKKDNPAADKTMWIADGKKYVMPCEITVEMDGDMNSDWPKWLDRLKAAVQYAPDSLWLDDLSKINKAAYKTWSDAHDEEAQAELAHIIMDKRDSFDGSPFDEVSA